MLEETKLSNILPLSKRERRGLTVVGLFAGIGGVELGLHGAGHRAIALCEIDNAAQRILRAQFPESLLLGDIRSIQALPQADLITAGFPCQDLSQAGRTAGITGSHSGLVQEVFRLLDASRPRWLLLENVPFMLRLQRGRAMHYLTSELSKRGYRWAYRVVDTRAFGLPQRRQRVLLLASRVEDPRPVIFADDIGEPSFKHVFSDRKEIALLSGTACGFYWTEGLRGLGWAVDATPPLKGGSSVGIPSPPAVLLPSGQIVTPDIRDAERLQGFPAGWTELSLNSVRRRNGPRWRLVGNAVSVPVARWLGGRLSQPGTYRHRQDTPLPDGHPWPNAAWSTGRQIYKSDISVWPKRTKRIPLAQFLKNPQPLSLRAIEGFRSRTLKSSLLFPEGFLDAVDRYLEFVK